MPIQFAAANDTDPTAARYTAHLHAANDNGDGLGEDGVLRAALRHFAKHGLSAASRARDNAECAFLDGNHAEYRHWMAICRALDRRMAGSAAI
jgi:hypothetical protein